MPGLTLRIQEKNTFSFLNTNNQQIPFGKSVLLPIATNIDLSQFLWAALIVRVHNMTVGASTGTGTGPTISAALCNSAPTQEDPGLIFRLPLSSAVITTTGVTYTVQGAGSIGPLLDYKATTSAALTGSFGDAFLYFTQWTATSAADITATVSVDLVLKS